MKKASLLFIILLIPSVFAISSDIKQVYQPGETLIAEIAGNILEPIPRENVELRRSHVQVPFEYDIQKLGSKYFIWGTLPTLENNYTLIIRDIATTINGANQRIDFRQNFSTSGDIVSYSIKPGFFKTNDEFEIIVNSNSDFDQTIIVNFPNEHELILSPGENKLTFSASEAPNLTGLNKFNFGFYSVPLFITRDKLDIEITETLGLPKFRFVPKTIESVILYEETADYPFTLSNTGDEPIQNIIFEYNKDLFIIFPSSLEVLEPRESFEFEIILKSNSIPINEKILARSGDFVTELDLNIDYTELEDEIETPYLEEDYTESEGYYCSGDDGLGGKFCTAGELCSTNTVPAIDGPNCCLGVCEKPEAENSFAWIGYLIGAIIAIVLVIVGARYFKAKKQANPLKRRLAEAQEKHPTHQAKKRPS